MNKVFLYASFAVLSVSACDNPGSSLYQTGDNWPAYGGNKAGNRYSPLDQINLGNVRDLEVAWMYQARDPLDSAASGQRIREIQCQPVVMDGVLYGTTPELALFAVNAATGEALWEFSPPIEGNRNRGVMYWENGTDKRIFYTVEAELYGIDAKTGKLIPTFGTKGVVDLREGLSTDLKKDISNARVRATSPGVIYKNTLIIGSAVSESGDAAPGHIRAFNVVTGKLEWVFRTIPHPGEPGFETWPAAAHQEIGGANSWSGMVLDEAKGVVFLGTGSPAADFYGGNRPGQNLFANCILALDANDGRLKWFFQTVSHDLWDRDIPLPPNFASIEHNGKQQNVVVQATKEGFVYVLDSETGESLFPIEELPVSTEGLPGETPWPTQKFPTKPKPFSRQVYTEDDISDISETAREYTRKIYEQYRTDHMYTPPREGGTLLFGYSGGAEWGGNAVDPDGILYQNSNDNPWILEMVENPQYNKRNTGELLSGSALYAANCAACHGVDRKGNGTDFPNISNVKNQFSRLQLLNTVTNGVGRMPSFQHLSAYDRQAIVDFLWDGTSPEPPASILNERNEVVSITTDVADSAFGFQPRYVIKAWTKLFDPDGYPGIKPPWGTLNAIDLRTGEYLWRVPLGEFPELTEKGIPITGTESYGGPIVTAGGLVFIAGTKDERIRAFNKKTGEVVWEYQLPAGGFATPVTYAVNDRQYIAIAAGGARGQQAGHYYIAFALPE
ncbi:outer membrane protein assembly factor BamB family protein [Parapedobacter lycopersici]|uniref:outer membrane protein assembly factor BamB family protein n=1 Tax=Parapedobacter lycopersici TaxID=1864939 RepID=UPI00214D2176|nr:PQQ-binding-like beta-propeller repeat protein [Parapedobacter lycopersici]